MNQSPKVSVIIPTCNGRDSVQRSVSSVLSQNYDNLEVIVVDDNPDDATEKLSKILLPDPRVQIVRNIRQHGPSQARNYGVQCAGGDLITFLDDDDCYLQGRIKTLVDHYCGAEDGYSFISAGRFVEVGDFSAISVIPGQKFGVINLSDIYLGNSIDIGFLMRADLFRSLGGFDESLSSLEDWDLIIRALKVKEGYKVKRFDYVVNRTDGRNRVSDRETNGYFDMANKYDDEFGEKWSFIQRSRGLSLSGQLFLSKAIHYSVKASSLRPMRLYLSSKFPRLIKFVRNIVAG